MGKHWKSGRRWKRPTTVGISFGRPHLLLPVLSVKYFFVHIMLGYPESHKWLGCMLCASPGLDSDVEYHLQQAAKAFQKHGWILKCKNCFIKHRLRYFEAIVSSTTCFAAEHRPLYRKHLEKFASNFENLFVALLGLHHAQIGQHSGMIFCMVGTCVWITDPMPVEFLGGQRNA